MAVLTKNEIIDALERLGELAAQKDHSIELLIVGGAAMILLYDARLSTRDIDAFILSPEGRIVRGMVEQIAEESDLPEDWLNDGAKGYLMGISPGPLLFSAPGIMVRSPAVVQLLAMKLSAWRDEIDIADAQRLMQEVRGEQQEVWDALEPYLVPGSELKAQYAFLDLWESIHGEH